MKMFYHTNLTNHAQYLQYLHSTENNTWVFDLYKLLRRNKFIIDAKENHQMRLQNSLNKIGEKTYGKNGLPGIYFSSIDIIFVILKCMINITSIIFNQQQKSLK